jgi:NTE family protein
MAKQNPAPENPEPLNLKNKRIVLLLQGGGALGAYQVGAYEALQKELQRQSGSDGDAALDWVGGISIGAINAAVIAGPRKANALLALQDLWNDILTPEFLPFDYTSVWQNLPALLQSGRLAPLEPKYGDWMWMAYNFFGQENFFTSRVLNPFLNPWFLQWLRPLAHNELSFYGTEPLRATLDRHVDWSSINQPEGIRLSLGATGVADGEVVFFNNFNSEKSQTGEGPGKLMIQADHVMASGALPPAFPPISIDDGKEVKLYWDGGLSTNTPIEALEEDLTADSTKDTLVFLINLWDRKRDATPQSLDDVLWRQKSIQFGSRKKAAEAVVENHGRKVLLAKIPPTHLEVCQVMFESDDSDPQFSFSDADFSRATFEKMRAQGKLDMQNAIKRPERVGTIGGDYAALYRYGAKGKHKKTDLQLVAKQQREHQRMTQWQNRKDQQMARLAGAGSTQQP